MISHNEWALLRTYVLLPLTLSRLRDETFIKKLKDNNSIKNSLVLESNLPPRWQGKNIHIERNLVRIIPSQIYRDAYEELFRFENSIRR